MAGRRPKVLRKPRLRPRWVWRSIIYRLRLVFLYTYLSSWAPLLRIGISKTASQIFTKFSGFFGGPPGTSNPSKSQNLLAGFWGRGWGRKKFDPLNLPPRGSWGPQIFFSRGSTKSLLYCQISRPCDKNWGVGGQGNFLIFFETATYNTGSDSEHALGPIIVFISSYRGRNLLHWSRTAFWISSPFWRYGLPNFTNFFEKFCQKFTSAWCEEDKG